MSARPVIGLTSYGAEASWGVWKDVPAVLLPADYVRKIVAAGGIPVLLPPLPEVIAQVVPRLDGVVITGGPDVDPATYGQPRQPGTVSQRVRDDAELAVFTAAVRADRPVLGICRGLQLINVARGGTLHQHLPDLPDLLRTGDHSSADDRYLPNPVTVEQDSLLARALGSAAVEVRCHHHQAVDRLGAGLRISATAAGGVVEAIEDPARQFLLAVQWHPEVEDESGSGRGLFEALVAACGSPAGPSSGPSGSPSDSPSGSPSGPGDS